MPIFLIIFLIILLALAILTIALYFKLAILKQRLLNASNQVDVGLQRKFDLIPNLENLIEKYSSKSNPLIKKANNLRSEWINLKTTNEKLILNKKLSYVFNPLLKFFDNYPDSKIDNDFIAIQTELNQAEDTIPYSIQIHNDLCEKYNKEISIFPISLFAKIFKFKKQELLNENKIEKAIKLDFED